MTDEEVKREAAKLLAAVRPWDTPFLAEILAALRRVRDAATAAERQRCAAMCKERAAISRKIAGDHAVARLWSAVQFFAERARVEEMCAAAIERQEGE